jgi:Ca2+-binding RTX toxin-like protein
LVVGGATLKSSSGFNSTAAISVNNGTLDIGGASTWSSSLAITGGSTVKIAAASTLSGAVTLTDGTLTGAGALTLSNQLNWSSGTIISGTGKKTVSGALNLSGYQSLDGTTLETSGATIWTGAGYLYSYNGAIWNNTSTGTIDLQGDADFYLGSGTPSFNNAGTFTKSNGATNDESYFNVVFNNTGTVNVKKGTLTLAGGGTNSKTFSIDTGAILKITNDYNFNTGNSVAGAGILSLEYSTVAVSAVSTWSAPIVINGGTLSGTGALTISNKLTWNNGTISGTGKKTVSGAFNLTNGDGYLGGTTLETTGATIWAGTSRIFGINGGVWNSTSTGTIDLQGDGDFIYSSGTAVTFNNAGTFTKSNGATDGSDNSYFSIIVNNTGTIDVKKGTLIFDGGYTQTAGTTRLSGGNLTLNSYNAHAFDLKGGVLTGVGTITGGAGAITAIVNNTGGQVNPGNTVGTLVIDGFYGQSGTGLLNFDLASASSFDKFNVTGEGDFGGTLKVTLGTGYTPTIGTKFTVLTYGTATTKTFNTVQGIDLSTSLALAPSSPGNNLILEVVDKVPDLGAVSFGNTKSFTDAVGDSDLFDFYRFNVSAADTVQLKLTNLTANADIWLVDSLGRTLAQGTQTGTADEAISWAVYAGTYFVKVFQPAAGNNTNYTLQVATTSIPAVITVAATDASAAETATGVTANPGTFTLTRTGDVSQAITVNYTLAGTATNGTDYTNLPLTATFAAGASTALVTVTPTDDALAEATENVVLTLATGTGYSLGTAINATVNIADNETPVVTIAATDASAAETATGVTPNPGTFTLTRLGNLASALTVNYTVTGSATNGTDYTTIPLTATFAAGASTVLVTVTPTDDALAEATENVVLTLATGTGYSLGTATSATVNIADNEIPLITVAATDASAAETATGVTPNPGTFTLTRLGNLASALTVNYTVTGTATNGTDYTSLPLTATFAAGASTALVTVTPTDDSLAEATENVVLTLATGTGYSLGTTTSATVNIADNETPVVTIAATDASAAETATGVTANPGTFTLTRLGNLASALTVNYTVTGSATNGTDYTNIPLSATFLAGASTALVTVTPTDDALAEATENVVLTLTTGTGYNLGTTTSATVNIADNETPVVTIAATDASAAETATGVTANPGTFTLTRLGNLASALTVNYTVTGSATNGTDYTTLPLTATFAAGASTAVVTVTPTDDTLAEATENVVLTLATGTGYSLGTTTSATVNIADNETPVITVAATDASAAETATGVTPNPGTFTLTRLGNLASALTVNYTVTGSATNGTDYTTLPLTATFAAGASTVLVTVTPTDDTVAESSETATLTLATGTGYSLGTTTSATVNIADNETPVITVAATDASAAETATGVTPNPGTFTLTRLGNLASALTVNYTLAGTATNGTDYTTIPLTATFAAGSNTALVNVSPIDDSSFEGTETVILNLGTGTGYTLGTTASATVNIDDNDTAGSAEITVSATDASAAETATGVTPNPGTFTFARTGNTVSALTVNYTLSGTAINGSDYTSLVGTVTFAANASTATVNVNPLDDTIFETSTPETVILTLATGTGYTLGSATTGTVSITDNDSQPVINLSASQTVVEGFTSPQTVSYTVTLANASSQPITVNYATANGTALAGSDYTSTSGTLTFNAGVTSQVINIPILNDSLNETNETFTLSLTSPTNATLGTSTVTTTITDTLTASVTTTLPANVENLTLTGTAVADGTGNAGANVLTGNSANNILAGLDGNDTYVFVANSLLGIDTINETATGGTDTLDFTGTNGPIRLNLGVITNQTVVTSNLTLKLSAIDGIENVYGGNGSDRLTGNNLSNALYGNGGADSLSGGGGADSLVGGAGDDLLGGGAGNDSFVYSTGKAFLSTDLGLDTLLDFTTTADKLVLSKATFTALTSAIGNGFSQGTEFAIVEDDALAGSSSAFIVYSSNSGSLFYNQNGNASGLGTGAEFAVLFGIPTLSSGDFSLVA